MWILLPGLLALACTDEARWQVVLPDSGTYASPGAVDLNSDGVADIVLGAGGNKEWEPSENGVLAFNGKNGRLLWKAPCRNQVVGTPVFADVSADGTPDVIIGGRSAQLMALDGSTGETLWEYLPHNPATDYFNDTSILNFFTPQLVPDQNGDGAEDLLTAYGGFVKARPWEYERPAGQLLLVCARTGQLLHRVFMPDGRETYMSPVVLQKNGALHVIFGTGGETINGNLYIAPLADLLDNRLDQYQILARGEEKGFIAPPVLADITADGQADIIVNAFEGNTLAFSGRNLRLLWQATPGPGYETHSQPAPGQFTGNPATDFFINYGKGQWPQVEGALQVIIDGQTGQLHRLDSTGNLQYAAPVVVEAEGRQQVIFPVNMKIPTGFAPETGQPAESLETRLMLFDPATGQSQSLAAAPGANIGSTVLLQDLDKDGRAELVFVHNNNPYDPFTFNGISVACISAPGTAGPWSRYMGVNGKSTLPLANTASAGH